MEAIILKRAEDDWFQLYKKHGDRFDPKFLSLLKLLESNPELGAKFRIAPFRRLIVSGYTIGVFMRYLEIESLYQPSWIYANHQRVLNVDLKK